MIYLGILIGLIECLPNAPFEEVDGIIKFNWGEYLNNLRVMTTTIVVLYSIVYLIGGFN